VNEKNSLSEVLDQFPKDDPLSVSRRRFIAAGAAAMATGFLATNAGAAPLQGGRTATALRQSTPPADAAPPEKQVIIFPADVGTAKVLDFYEQVYQRPFVADLFSEPLVRLNREFEIIPGMAESWEGSEDGMTWTFKLRQGLTWTDGNPLTAADWVATFQYAANPEHAWDFTWFFQGVLKGWDDAIAGKAGVDTVGVAPGANPNELVITTVVPAP